MAWPFPAPQVLDTELPFWTGGQRNKLLVQRCSDCCTWRHPPRPICGSCWSLRSSFEVAAGTGMIYSLTVNHHPWQPELPVPYVIASVELDEQPGLRLLSSIVGPGAFAAAIGDRTRVAFEHLGELWLPVFTLSAK